MAQQAPQSRLQLSPSNHDAQVHRHLVADYGRLPLSFEPNVGQVKGSEGEPVRFVSRGRGYTLYVTSSGVLLKLATARSSLLRLSFEGADADTLVGGQDELPGKANYFIGRDPKQWHTNIATYRRVRAHGIYAGIDADYYGRAGQLEYDLRVAPGADAKTIRMRIDSDGRNGQSRNKIRLAANGDLVIGTAGGEVRLHKPVVYQEEATSHEREYLEGHYKLLAGSRVGFEVAAYDRARPLVIDPVLTFSTYLGGSGGENGLGIAVDSNGNTYVVGTTTSTNFPVKNSIQTAGAGDADAFITKLGASGGALVYSTYIGGSGFEQANAVAVDSSGNAYLTGQTQSSDFPSTTGAFQTTSGGNSDAFVAKLNSSGSALQFASYLGGSEADFGQGIAVSSTGIIFVTGSTQSTDFPTQSPLQSARKGTTDAFITKVKSDGTALLYSTYLGGGGADLGLAIAIDGSGNAYLTGATSSTDFPVTGGAAQTTPGGNGDAFVAKLNGAGSALVFSTYLGGNGFDRADAIAVDSSGASYVTGLANSTNFPTVTPFQSASAGKGDAFVTKVAPDGSSFVYSTYLGGLDNEEGFGIAVGSGGESFVTGYTQSDNFPVLDPFQSSLGGGTCGTSACSDAFVVELDSTGSALVYSTFLGGNKADFGNAIVLDSSQNVYLTGSALSANFPTIVGSFQRSIGSSSAADAFVAKIGGSDAPSVGLSPASLSFPDTANGTSSSARNVTLFNFGSAVLNILGISISGPFTETHTCGATLSAGGSHCTISVTFKPTATGAATGTLKITDDALGSPHTVALSGTGLEPAPAATLSPTSLDFGNVTVGDKSAVQAITLTNSGTATMTVTAITLGGTDFSQTNDCPGTLAAGASCTISATFAPVATGSLADTITVEDNAPTGHQQTQLGGVGVAVFSLSSNPANVTLSRNSGSKTFTVSATAPSSFTSSISLTCSVPTGVSCAFNPTSITPGATTTLTVSNYGTGSGDFTIGIQGTSGNQNTSLGIPVVFTNLGVSLSPTLVTIQAGQSASYTATFKPVNGFNEATDLTCGFFLASTDLAACFVRTVQDTSCTISPATVTPDGTNNLTASITITTKPSTGSAPPPAKPLPPVPPLVWVVLLLATGFLMIVRRRVPGNSIPLATVLLFLALSTSCDTTFTPLFQGPASTTGTPGGLYSVGIVAKAGSSVVRCNYANLGVNTSTK